jgi:hypothetical protein
LPYSAEKRKNIAGKLVLMAEEALEWHSGVRARHGRTECTYEAIVLDITVPERRSCRYGGK